MTKTTSYSFDATQHKPAESWEAIPAAHYPVAITDGEMAYTKAGDGEMMKLEMTVLDGEFKGRKIWANLNVVNKSAMAQQIACEMVSAICHATGTIRFKDVSELFNKPFSAKIGIGKTSPDYPEPKNELKGAKPLTQTRGEPAPANSPGGWGKPDVTGPGKPAAPAAKALPPKAPPGAITMTAKAKGLTAEDFRKSDPSWTDELLIKEGYAEAAVPPPDPIVPTPPATPTAPSAPVDETQPPWAQ